MTFKSRLIVWLGVCVLAMQTLIPGAAMSHDDASPFVLCTADGAKSIAAIPGVPQPAKKGFAGMPCERCLVASLTAVVPPPAIEVVRPIPVADAVAAPLSSRRRPPSRAPPPRPPSQGPPLRS